MADLQVKRHMSIKPRGSYSSRNHPEDSTGLSPALPSALQFPAAELYPWAQQIWHKSADESHQFNVFMLAKP